MLLARLTILTCLISIANLQPRAHIINELLDYAVVKKIKEREDAWKNFDMKNMQPVSAHLSDLRRLEKEFSVHNEFEDTNSIKLPKVKPNFRIRPKNSSRRIIRTTKVHTIHTNAITATKQPMTTSIRTTEATDVKQIRLQFVNELEKKLLSEQEEIPTTKKEQTVTTTTKTIMPTQIASYSNIFTTVPLKDHFQILLEGNKNNLNPSPNVTALSALSTPRNLTEAVGSFLMAQSPNQYSSSLMKGEEDEAFKNSARDRSRTNPFPLELILDTGPVNKSASGYSSATTLEGLIPNELLLQLIKNILKPEVPVPDEIANRNLENDLLAIGQASNLLVPTSKVSKILPHRKLVSVLPGTVSPSTYLVDAKNNVHEQDKDKEVETLLAALSPKQYSLKKDEASPSENSRANSVPLQLILQTLPVTTSDYTTMKDLKENELLMEILHSLRTEAPVDDEMSNGEVLTISQGDNLLKLIPTRNGSEILPHRVFVPQLNTTGIPSSSKFLPETRSGEEEKESFQDVAQRLNLKLREITRPESHQNVDIMISNMRTIYQLMGRDTWKERQKR